METSKFTKAVHIVVKFVVFEENVVFEVKLVRHYPGLEGPGPGYTKIYNKWVDTRTKSSLMFPQSFLSRPQTFKLFRDLATYLLLK